MREEINIHMLVNSPGLGNGNNLLLVWETRSNPNMIGAIEGKECKQCAHKPSISINML